MRSPGFSGAGGAEAAIFVQRFATMIAGTAIVARALVQEAVVVEPDRFVFAAILRRNFFADNRLHRRDCALFRRHGRLPGPGNQLRLVIDHQGAHRLFSYCKRAVVGIFARF